ncbi:hypothetical protein [Micromonospora sp. NPDC005174]|uniref:hypothetical protein n=1 Tax=Micromonospora sp. NPDC005174 TaxID=3157018 RepID=UPI0033AFDD29
MTSPAASEPTPSTRGRTPVVLAEDADARLRELDLSVETLHASIRVGDTARRRVTGGNYPVTYPGVVMWAETLAALRSKLPESEGWRIGRSGNYETVYSPSLKIGITVVAGDEDTGQQKPSRGPRLKRSRGPKTSQRVRRNFNPNQLSLDLEALGFTIDVDRLPEDEDCQTWFLVVHPTDDDVRIEFSLPTDMSGDGNVSEWSERILVEALMVSGVLAPKMPNEDDDDEGDSNLVRRRG